MRQERDGSFGAGVQNRVLKASVEGLAAATGTGELSLQTRLVREVIDALWIPFDLPEEDQSVQLDAAYALMREIAPRDAMEGLLTAQMVGVHGAAMDCLRRAMQPGQSDDVRESALKLAASLLKLYPRQLEALDRRRGRGSHHRVTVEHVTVHAEPEAQDNAPVEAIPAAEETRETEKADAAAAGKPTKPVHRAADKTEASEEDVRPGRMPRPLLPERYAGEEERTGARARDAA
jgi:hypothetical protein